MSDNLGELFAKCLIREQSERVKSFVILSDAAGLAKLARCGRTKTVCATTVAACATRAT